MGLFRAEARSGRVAPPAETLQGFELAGFKTLGFSVQSGYVFLLIRRGLKSRAGLVSPLYIPTLLRLRVYGNDL
jgi:hypothetical protein